MQFGNAGTSGAYLRDKGKVVVFEDPRYDTGGAADSDEPLLPNDFYEVFANFGTGDFVHL